MANPLDTFADQLLMLDMARHGSSTAHRFLENLGKSPAADAAAAKERARCFRGGTRFFTPPKEEDTVVMFADNSGVYLHKDGLCTIMGSDISHEIHQWAET